MAESNDNYKPTASQDQDVPRKLEDLREDLADVKRILDHAVRALIEKKSEYTLLARQAEWHIRGLIYHYHRMLSLYEVVAGEVGGRALTIANTAVIVMHSPDMQDLIFEFYALVNLARITLDELVKYVRPLFVPGAHLPKSINDFLKGQSDCPLNVKLSDQIVLNYLVDIRNCIVHYRTFATSDNTLAVADDADESLLEEVPFGELRSVTRVYYRHFGENKVSVNVLLPDIIFEYDEAGVRTRMARPFSYSRRHNLMSQSREFIRLCTFGVWVALDLLADKDRGTYSWQRS